jgi:integrase
MDLLWSHVHITLKVIIGIVGATGFEPATSALSDLKELRWQNVAENIELRSNKTGRIHRIPLNNVVRRHIASLPRDSDRLFNLTSCHRQLRREMDRICQAAGVSKFTPQGLRRLGINLWSQANAEAGRIVHGCHLGVMSHYLDPLRLLLQASGDVQLPRQFYTADELHQRDEDERTLIRRFRRASSRDRRLLVDISRRLN